MKIPKDAQYLTDGLYYKKGVHDIVFKRVNDEWVRSGRYWTDIKKGQRVIGGQA